MKKMQRILTLILFAILAGCASEPANVFQGYVEGEYVHVSSPIGGTLITLAVSRGQQITTDAPLFTLDRDFEQAAVDETRYGLAQAKNNLANLEKGQRPSEIDAIKARLRQSLVSAKLAETEYRRRVKLLAAETISQEELDQAKSDFDRKAHSVKEIKAELQTARLGARSDEISAATATVGQAESKLTQALWNFDQKSKKTPATGLVFDTLYRVGEWVAAGSPVVSLLPPENIEVRFFVPEAIVGMLQKGQKTVVTFDGAPQPINTFITYISPSAEFTPPVIYSSSSRAKLVFMIKAKPAPEDAQFLHPGQPVDVTIPALHP